MRPISVPVRDFALRDVAQRIEQRELVIGLRHRRGQRHARLLHVGLGGLLAARPPDPAVRDSCPTGPDPTTRSRAHCFRYTRCRRTEAGRARCRNTVRASTNSEPLTFGYSAERERLDIRRRLRDARLRLRDRRAACQRFVDQLRQLRVAELLGPVERRPLAALRRQALRGLQRVVCGWAICLSLLMPA